MKQCIVCGAIQNDSRTVCVDCGAPLNSPLTGDEAAIEQKRLERKISKLTRKADALSDGTYVAPHDVVFGAISAVCFVLLTVTKLHEAGETATIGAVSLFFTALMFLFPKIVKFLFKVRSFGKDKDYMFLIMLRLSKYIFFTIGMIMFILSFLLTR